ncbi:MAG: hypothetical protein J5J00_12025 [Deltaproteobacteria bacterium]|nr:hypothetical protein [Deltaproteobacteria bacterium]
MGTVRVNQQQKRIEIQAFEVGNEVVFNYFESLPASERESKLIKALYIGVLALMEDRLSAFLSKTANELGTELESLKMIFDMKRELFYKSAVKGTLAEDDIAEFLQEYLSSRKIEDRVSVTGNKAGALPRNKTGDIVCDVNGSDDIKICIECKFDKSIKLGDIESKDIFTKKMESAWSQLIEAQANRESRVGIIVFDASIVDGSIQKYCEHVGYIPGIGFIAIIDSQKGDYTNLAIAYMLARDLALKCKTPELDKDLLAAIITRIIKDTREIIGIKSLVEANMENCKEILKQLEKGLLLMEFNKQFLAKFLKEGTLTKKELLEFYMGEGLRDQFQAVAKEIEALSSGSF